MVARLRREDDRSLGDVAAKVGYDSESSFSRVFRKWLGASPGVFRRAARSSSGV
jgi:AraC-like DNA-binding protein